MKQLQNVRPQSRQQEKFSIQVPESLQTERQNTLLRYQYPSKDEVKYVDSFIESVSNTKTKQYKAHLKFKPMKKSQLSQQVSIQITNKLNETKYDRSFFTIGDLNIMSRPNQVQYLCQKISSADKRTASNYFIQNQKNQRKQLRQSNQIKSSQKVNESEVKNQSFIEQIFAKQDKDQQFKNILKGEETKQSLKSSQIYCFTSNKNAKNKSKSINYQLRNSLKRKDFNQNQVNRLKLNKEDYGILNVVGQKVDQSVSNQSQQKLDFFYQKNQEKIKFIQNKQRPFTAKFFK